MKTGLWQIAFCLALLLGWLSPIYGQSKLGRLVLVLTDEIGAVVPGVEIQIDSAQTHVSQKTISDANGEAVLRGLPFGAYTISISDKRFEPIRQNLLVNSEVSQYLRFQLRIRRLASELTVSSEAPLVDPLKTSGSLYLGEDQILKRVSTLPNRDSIAMVASLPGWVLESNGVLHPRGSEYQTQYVVDGVPIFDNRSPGFASAPLIESADSLEVITAGIPAEFGRKLGGVINLVSRAQRDQSRGELQLQGGNQSVLAMMAQLSGQRKNLGYSGLLSARHTSRYLDPPSIENLHNQANLASGYLRLDYAAGSDNFFRILAWANGTHLQVPNEVFQQQAGQAQTRRNRDENLTLGWDHYYSGRATSSLEYYRRQASSELNSNPLSTPIIAHQDRKFTANGVTGSLSWIWGKHQLKAGGDNIVTPVREFFTFVAGRQNPTDNELSSVNFFGFSKRRTSWEYSSYLQDQWRWKNFTTYLGLRYDGYRFLVHDQAWSPRLGLGYFVPLTHTNIHFAYDRAFQTPSIENLLLTSSEEAQSLSPLRLAGKLGGKPVPASLANFYELGFSQALGGRIRLDGQVFRRTFRHFADDDIFFNTGVSFPISLSRARIKGAELRLEVLNWHGFSGSASYSNLLGFSFTPITGGLFVGEDIGKLLQPNQRLPISQDQRNTLYCQFYYQPKDSRWWLGGATRYESGLPVELDDPTEASQNGQLFPSTILAQVDFTRGRVRPRHIWDISTGVHLWKGDRRQVTFQLDLLNLMNRFYLINFNGLFSGTALGLPRTVILKTTYQF